MTASYRAAHLTRRAILRVYGPGWRDFLQGLITQDVLSLGAGELRFGALLTPQGRLLYDLFLIGLGDGCLIDCAAEHRDQLLSRLSLYRLRAKVEIVPVDTPVIAAWADSQTALTPEGGLPDPRHRRLGWRVYAGTLPPAAQAVDGDAYETHCLTLGIPGPNDWGCDETYPIEANFDLLNGIDFQKGCFVGQETTSRMKRRGAVRNRMIPVRLSGKSPAQGAELLAGTLRVGEVKSVCGDRAMALVRLDRLAAGERTFDGGAWSPEWPEWLAEPGSGA